MCAEEIHNDLCALKPTAWEWSVVDQSCGRIVAPAAVLYVVTNVTQANLRSPTFLGSMLLRMYFPEGAETVVRFAANATPSPLFLHLRITAPSRGN